MRIAKCGPFLRPEPSLLSRPGRALRDGNLRPHRAPRRIEGPADRYPQAKECYIVKRNLAVAVLTGAMVSLSMWGAGTSAAENRNSASGGFETRVALLDLAHVFKSYQKFIN